MRTFTFLILVSQKSRFVKYNAASIFVMVHLLGTPREGVSSFIENGKRT